MSTRAMRAPVSYGPQAGRASASAVAGRRSAEAASARRRSAEVPAKPAHDALDDDDHHEHAASCPMHDRKRGREPTASSGFKIRVTSVPNETGPAEGDAATGRARPGARRSPRAQVKPAASASRTVTASAVTRGRSTPGGASVSEPAKVAAKQNTAANGVPGRKAAVAQGSRIPKARGTGKSTRTGKDSKAGGTEGVVSDYQTKGKGRTEEDRKSPHSRPSEIGASGRTKRPARRSSENVSSDDLSAEETWRTGDGDTGELGIGGISRSERDAYSRRPTAPKEHPAELTSLYNQIDASDKGTKNRKYGKDKPDALKRDGSGGMSDLMDLAQGFDAGRSNKSKSPESGSAVVPRKRELDKFLDEMDFDKSYGGPREKATGVGAEKTVDYKNMWRTGDGDEELMNDLRNKPRDRNDRSLSPDWDIADLVMKKDSEANVDGTHSKGSSNRASSGEESSDERDRDTSAPKAKSQRSKDKPAKKKPSDFSGFDDFLSSSLSAVPKLSGRSALRDVRRKPDRPAADSAAKHEVATPHRSESPLRPAAAARTSTAAPPRSRSRSGSEGRGVPAQRPAAGGRRAGALEDLIQPRSAASAASTAPLRRDARSPKGPPRSGVSGRPADEAGADRGSPRDQPRSSQGARRWRAGDDRETSHSPSPDGGGDHHKRGHADSKQKPGVRESHADQKQLTQTRKENNAQRRHQDHMVESTDRQNRSAARKRRSSSPSPNGKETHERYLDTFPDRGSSDTSPPPGDRSHRGNNVSSSAQPQRRHPRSPEQKHRWHKSPETLAGDRSRTPDKPRPGHADLKTRTPSPGKPRPAYAGPKTRSQNRVRTPSPGKDRALHNGAKIRPEYRTHTPSPERESPGHSGPTTRSQRTRTPSPEKTSESHENPSSLFSPARPTFGDRKTPSSEHSRRHETPSSGGKSKRRSLSLAGMSNPDRDEDEGGTLRRLIMAMRH
ncbi:serine/arginine repetitive matrix protein 2-like [Pollicipes pollicipes]|uniref:serine/arginine repetitive matrix protein 2-like n=1 Tax=Pollicipes pollicipes TaxID=41117 RepID=UPI0018857A2D|nr:serine/arginine repetitive matrix protein 2-like [Pollicipes pollicipes]